MTQTILTCSPDSDDLALREVRRAVPAGSLSAEIAEGVLLLEAAFEALAAAWRAKAPIFVRHICPVHTRLALPATDDEETLLILLRSACEDTLLPRLLADQPFSVQTRLFTERFPLKPFEINGELAEIMPHAPLDVRQPAQIISVVVGHAHGTLTAWLGISAAADNLSDWAGGARRFAREQGRISRSEFKLLEALEAFGVQMPARGYALDLGAAPGGWTHVLRERGMYVTAVDPAALDARVLNDSGVRYKRMTAEAYLRADPDLFDVIVNDMRMDARDSARLMNDYARLLRRDGAAIMTLKLPESGRVGLLDHTFDLLERVYHIAGARQLFHNRSEITLYLKRR